MSFWDGAAYCAGEFPAQFYTRAVLLIVSESLGMHVAGIYVYIRQVMSAAGQAIMLIKRVEFRQLRQVATTHPVKMATVFEIQRPSLTAALIVFAGSVGARFAVPHLPANLGDAASQLPYFCASIPVWAVSLSLGQVMIMNGNVRAYSAIMFVNTAIVCTIASELIRYTGLLFLSFLDIISFSVQALAYYHIVRMRAAS